MDISRRTILLASATTILFCALPTRAIAPLNDHKDRRIAESLAPSGRLRVAINLGNTVLAQRASSGVLTGISVLLARRLAKRLHLPIDLIPYDAAGKVFAAQEKGEWDLAFLAVQPERAAKIDFSPPYVFIEGTYLVRADGPFRRAADLDRSGVRIAVGRGAAYDLYLSRTLKDAEIVRAPTSPEAVDLFLAGKADAVAGVRQFLEEKASAAQGVRVLPDSFQRIDQAVGVPKGRAAGAAYVRAFIEEMKRSGEIQKDLDATGQAGISVSPTAG